MGAQFGKRLRLRLHDGDGAMSTLRALESNLRTRAKQAPSRQDTTFRSNHDDSSLQYWYLILGNCFSKRSTDSEGYNFFGTHIL